MDQDEERQMVEEIREGLLLATLKAERLGLEVEIAKVKHQREVAALYDTQGELEALEIAYRASQQRFERERAIRIERTMMMLEVLQGSWGKPKPTCIDEAIAIGNHTLFHPEDDYFIDGGAPSNGHSDWWDENGPHAWTNLDWPEVPGRPERTDADE